MNIKKPKVFRAPSPPKPPTAPKAPTKPDLITSSVSQGAGKPSSGPMLKRGAKGGLYYELPGGRRIYVKKR